MLPFDRRPWAKPVAATVIVLALLADAWLAVYFYNSVGLHISEVAILFLLLLTVVPPNVAIILRKPGQTDPLLTHDRLSHPR